MNIGIIQPPYPASLQGISSAGTYGFIISQLQALPENLDWLLLPEYSNCPGMETRKALTEFIEKDSADYVSIIANTSKAKNVNIVAGCVISVDGILKNVILVSDRKGQTQVVYTKLHLTGYEKEEFRFIEGEDISSVVIDGIRVCFMTCLDIYYPELLCRIAMEKPDLIFCPSYQRFERPDVLYALSCSRAVDANAYFIRTAYAMGGNTGGHGMITDPSGQVLVDAQKNEGLFCCALNAGHKRRWPDDRDTFSVLEQSRKPSVYRSAGRGVILPDDRLDYPRINAHRGLSAYCPENSLAAFGAAVAFGADEIELDVCMSRDGQLIVSHDDMIDRIANGSGSISQMDWQEISRYDIGNAPSLQSKERLGWKHVGYCRLEDVFKQFAGRVIINIEIKHYRQDESIYPVIERTIELLYRYQCQKYAYIAGHKQALEAAAHIDGKIARCCMEGQYEMSVVENAIKYQCEKAQFFKPYCTDKLAEKIELAHQNGIRCNIAWSDDPDETVGFLEMGMDCILTNNILDTMNTVRNLGCKHRSSNIILD